MADLTYYGNAGDLDDYTVSVSESEGGIAGRVDAICAQLERCGFVAVRGLVTPLEIEKARDLVDRTIADSSRQVGEFASQTDIRYGRRAFCAIPTSGEAVDLSALLCGKLEPVLRKYCDDSSRVLEISTLTSYRGCSHQYVHLDPPGAICMFLAVEAISAEQGGTVFVPGSNLHSNPESRSHPVFGKHTAYYFNLYQLLVNCQILLHNVWKIVGLLRRGQLRSPREFRDRMYSYSEDNHQPNLRRFLRGRNEVFNVRMLGLRNIARIVKYRKVLREHIGIVRGSIGRGTVILYRSDVLHAGGDNNTDGPRKYFNLNIACRTRASEEGIGGYSPHKTLLASPITLGQLLARPRAA